MKRTYLATFLSGTSNLIEKILSEIIPDIEILTKLDGCIVLNTAEDAKDIISIEFLNNVFAVISEYSPSTKTTFSKMLELYQKQSLKSFSFFTRYLGLPDFRIRYVKANTFVTYGKKCTKNAETKTAADLGIKINRLNPKTEVWFMQREEGYSYVLLRLTNTSNVEHRKKGQIRPELAYLMCLLSEPKDSDIFLDPFAGYGTIIEERYKLKAKKIIGFDINAPQKNTSPIQSLDFFNNTLLDKSITKIVTDPPWGLFDNTFKIADFYPKMFKEFERIITDAGTLVLLTDRNIEIPKFIENTSFKIAESYKILVSGKKAALYKIRKN